MTVVAWVELSGENQELARAELSAATLRLGGSIGGFGRIPPIGWATVELPEPDSFSKLASRLALARRLAAPWAKSTWDDLAAQMFAEGRRGGSAAFRQVAPRGQTVLDPRWQAVASEFIRGGGQIRLTSPSRRFVVGVGESGQPFVAEETMAVDRRSFSERRMPKLPFQRPVSLPPRFARAAANLGRIGPGDLVVDPFVGTGALLIEAALVGARVSGGDRDPEMVKGALRNFEHSGARVEQLKVVDAGEPFDPSGGGGWDVLLTDPPYGRASGSAGEPPEALLARALPRWAEKVKPGGRIVIIVPGGPDPLPGSWRRTLAIPHRVHRSLTREFRVYERSPSAKPP